MLGLVADDEKVSAEKWRDWKWQQQRAVRSVEQLLEVFPGLPAGTTDAIRNNLRSRRLQLTPYTLSLIARAGDGSAPHPADPLWRQLVPHWGEADEMTAGYDGKTENWEMPEEMVTPIAQHKYDNRVIIRLANVCHGYCQFCYEALRTLERDSTKSSFQQKYWDATVRYLREHEGVEEVILSGGEPLMHGDEQLEQVLDDLTRLGRPLAIRIHTRALTFNPFRVTPALVALFRRHKVVAVGLHVTHPRELSDEFREAVDRLHGGVPILFANIPLLRDVNDSAELMHTLWMTLYSLGVVPHYLYHFMPFSPGGGVFRTPVQAGIDIVRALKRRVTNLAVPEFVIPHHSGKHSLPLLSEEDDRPSRCRDGDDRPVIRYRNWRGEVVDYPDVD
jgi:lysine 2,3-aminomutase